MLQHAEILSTSSCLVRWVIFAPFLVHSDSRLFSEWSYTDPTCDDFPDEGEVEALVRGVSAPRTGQACVGSPRATNDEDGKLRHFSAARTTIIRESVASPQRGEGSLVHVLEGIWKEEWHIWCHIVEKMMASTIEELHRVFGNSEKGQTKGIGRTMSLQ